MRRMLTFLVNRIGCKVCTIAVCVVVLGCTSRAADGLQDKHDDDKEFVQLIEAALDLDTPRDHQDETLTTLEELCRLHNVMPPGNVDASKLSAADASLVVSSQAVADALILLERCRILARSNVGVSLDRIAEEDKKFQASIERMKNSLKRPGDGDSDNLDLEVIWAGCLQSWDRLKSLRIYEARGFDAGLWPDKVRLFPSEKRLIEAALERLKNPPRASGTNDNLKEKTIVIENSPTPNPSKDNPKLEKQDSDKDPSPHEATTRHSKAPTSNESE